MRLVIRKELGDPPVQSQNGWSSGTGGDHDTMTICDVFHNLERARYTVWLTANQGYFNQMQYVVHIVQQPAREANEMAIVGADEPAVVGLDQPEASV